MKNYLYVYHSDINGAPSEESLAAWGNWFATLGDSVIDSGKPVVNTTESKGVFKDGASKRDKDTVVGYTVVKAENLDGALKMASGCPLSDAPGCEVRVYELGQM
jgi:hypothetical protein